MPKLPAKSNTPPVEMVKAMGLTTLKSDTKKFNTGAPGPSIAAPMLSVAGGFECNCGRSYASKATLAKECGKHDTLCRWCGVRFNTLAGTRQHERKAHRLEYETDLESKLPAPESDLMEKIAQMEAKSRNGVFYKEMMSTTELTHQQVRSRR